MDLTQKIIKIVREDGGSTQVRVGLLLDIDDKFIFMETISGVEVYPISRIIRFEVLSKESKKHEA